MSITENAIPSEYLSQILKPLGGSKVMFSTASLKDEIYFKQTESCNTSMMKFFHKIFLVALCIPLTITFTIKLCIYLSAAI